MEKSFIVDVITKLYIATDSNPVDAHTYELCSDLLDVVRICVACTSPFPSFGVGVGVSVSVGVGVGVGVWKLFSLCAALTL